MSYDNCVKIFDLIDIDKSGKIEFSEMLTKLMEPMNNKRTNAVKAMFDILDINHSNTITVDDFISTNTTNPKGTYFIEHVLGAYNTDQTITYTEFVNYYTDYSMTYKDDADFIAFLNKIWVGPPSPSDILLNKLATVLYTKWQQQHEDPSIITKDAVSVCIQDLNFELFDNQKLLKTSTQQVIDTINELLNDMLNINIVKLSYIAFIRKIFRIKSEFITKDEFVYNVNKLNTVLSAGDIIRIFELFNKNDNGIKVSELIGSLHIKLSNTRYAVVRSVFDKLDTTNSGMINSGMINSDAITVAADNQTSAQIPSEYESDLKVVTFGEFVNYYKDLSVMIEDDDEFAKKVNTSWNT